jgi:hypothetical protein
LHGYSRRVFRILPATAGRPREIYRERLRSAIFQEGNSFAEAIEKPMSIAAADFCAEQFVPEELSALADPQTAIPAIAKDVRLNGLIKSCRW